MQWEGVFELYTPLFLASFGSVDHLKGKLLGTILLANSLSQIAWLRD